MSIHPLSINTIRCLAADIVNKSNSGHPGMPIGMSSAAHILFAEYLNYNSGNDKWINRDRFVLSNGHGCALLYIMLHLTGYNISMSDLQSFRQLNSKCPGHPESGHTSGIEVTTGPLGQGAANAVGLAMAEKNLAANFNKGNYEIFNNKIWVFLGDGCMQEGITSEASSLAGHLKLNNLIYVYDDNGITIDGKTELSFTENVELRYKSYGWNTYIVKNGDTDIDDIRKAYDYALKSDKPTLILLRTTIGYGSERAGTKTAHGEPLGDKITQKLKEKFGFNPNEKFVVGDEVRKFYETVKSKGQQKESKWNKMFSEYAKQYPELANEIQRRFKSDLPEWVSSCSKYGVDDKAKATRQLSQEVLQVLGSKIPELIGGSADLAPSNLTEIKSRSDFSPANYGGSYIRFGVREHAMAAIGNGLAAYGAFLPYTATFLVFLPYLFPALRMAAIANHRQIFVMTHDSIGVGEDGPTHQPIETLAMCRATPNILVFRPCDGKEVVGAYNMALKHNGPSVLALSRQAMPNLSATSVENVAKGGYVVFESFKGKSKSLDVVLVASGSEVSLAIAAAKLLDLNVRVVSMVCMELFDTQHVNYRREVLPVNVCTISLEALTVFGWSKYVHTSIGMTSFGASAPGNVVMKYFGFDANLVKDNILNYLLSHDKQCNDMKIDKSFGPRSTHFAMSSKL